LSLGFHKGVSPLTIQLDQIIRFLRELDGLLMMKRKIPLYLIGGGAITLAYDPENRTADLDLIDPPQDIIKKGGRDSRLSQKYRLYISPLGEINFSVPCDWRAKCRPSTLAFQHLEIFIPCLEDIVLGKLARLEPKDFEDIFALHEKKLLNPNKLLRRLRENKKELKEITYRNNSRLLYKEIFQLQLIFEKRVPRTVKK